jgi:hypothetical protein
MNEPGSALNGKSMMISIEMKGLPPIEQIEEAILHMDHNFLDDQKITVEVSKSLAILNGDPIATIGINLLQKLRKVLPKEEFELIKAKKDNNRPLTSEESFVYTLGLIPMLQERLNVMKFHHVFKTQEEVCFNIFAVDGSFGNNHNMKMHVFHSIN